MGKNIVKRPLIISIFSIWGIVATGFGLLGLFSQVVRETIIQQYGEIYFYSSISTLIAMFISYIGYWKMKKWAVYLYTMIMIISIPIGLYFQVPGILNYLLPLIISVVGLVHIKKMS